MLPASPTATFPYRIVALVGEGAMGQVYRAEDVELGRPVAIKAIRPSFLESLSEDGTHEAMNRFIQEARAAAQLSHPGVTTVHRVGAEGGWPYIAMEWLEGRTLEDLLDQHQRISVENAARIGLQVLAVLNEAHRAGIVHRDIKPANLMLTPDRRIKVTDFGIARVQGSSLAQTQLGMALGTPQYASPEQLAGKTVDARADLYALGSVLYELVTGGPPFVADSIFDLILFVQTKDPVPAHVLAPAVPPEFDAFLQRALAKSPEQRFPSATAMARALQPFLTQPASPALAETASRESVPPAGDTTRTPLNVVSGTTPATMVAAVAHQWPPRALGRQEVARVLDRLLEKPLHAAPFCGVLDIDGALLLIAEGTLLAALDTQSGESGDRIIESLPLEGNATLRPCPETLSRPTMFQLAALLFPSEPRLSTLDAAFVDIPALVKKLQSEGFDGVIRFQRDAALGFVLISRGERVLELFGQDWPGNAKKTPWESWIAVSGALVSVEDRQVSFPLATFRRQLRDLCLDVVRPAIDAGTIMGDTRADAAQMRLRPQASNRFDLPSETTLTAMVDKDPAAAISRWILADVAYQFEQFGRSARWRELLEPLDAIETVRLHHGISLTYGRAVAFDATLFDGNGNARLVVERVAEGSRHAIEAFVSRVTDLKNDKTAGGQVSGAVLVAPNFTEEALDGYLQALRRSRRSVFAARDFLTHREGFLTIGRGGCHILLVEEVDGRRRPLVFQH